MTMTVSRHGRTAGSGDHHAAYRLTAYGQLPRTATMMRTAFRFTLYAHHDVLT